MLYSQARDASNVCVAFGSIKESSGGVSVLQSGKYAIVNIDGGGNVCRHRLVGFQFTHWQYI